MPQEAIIGITFVVAAAGVILMLSRVAGGKEELEHLLTGDILNVTSADVAKRAGTFAALGVFYGVFHKRFVLISGELRSRRSPTGMSVRLWDFLFYAAFALVVVSFVRIAGVLLTFAYLIVPAVCADMLAKDWARRLVDRVDWWRPRRASSGFWTSYKIDLPTGAAIVVRLRSPPRDRELFAYVRAAPADRDTEPENWGYCAEDTAVLVCTCGIVARSVSRRRPPPDLSLLGGSTATK